MRKLILLLLLAIATLALHAQSSDSTTVKKPKIKLDYGGALRFNYNLSSWKPNQKKRGGDFGFEVFRINIDAVHGKYEFHIDQRFYAAEFGGAFMKYGWFQYNLNEKSHLKAGLIPAYFGAQQFNSHSWFFQLPFYLGFEDDHDMGLSYSYENNNIQIDAGFYKNAETLSFADNAEVSDARYSYDFAGDNKELNQFNLRVNYKLGAARQHKLGGSLQYGSIWHIPTEDTGTQRAFGIHYEGKIKGLGIKMQYLNYDNRPIVAGNSGPRQIEMTAYGAPYRTAAKATIYSVGLSYTIPVKWGPITAIQLYNDYSYMDKAINSWEDTQMNVLGALISADPMYIYVDWASGLHQPWLGEEWTTALAAADATFTWESRFNVNFGYYF